MEGNLNAIDYSKPYQLTKKGSHHFFGYYGISPWSQNERYFICLETDFQDHMPHFGESARILLIDFKENETKIIATTRAWNFQQGAMLHWLPTNPNKKIIFNDTDGETVFSTIVNIETGEQRKLPMGINAIGNKKNIAVCVNFNRLRKCRKTVSYPCKTTGITDSHPPDDGLYIMDLESGEHNLIISYDDIWKASEKTRNMSKIKWFGRKLWFNHPVLNFSDTRLFFLARYRAFFRYLISSMWTIDIDGDDLYSLVDYGHKLSHFAWMSDEDIMVTMKLEDFNHRSYVILKDKSNERQLFAENLLKRDGHPSLSPDKTMLATDTYRIDKKRFIFLCDLLQNPVQVEKITSFNTNKISFSQLRCDPHPRWNHTGDKLCYDGLGRNGRQIYLIDINRV
jgi:hypothetical protein